MGAWQAISMTACNLLQTSARSHPAPPNTEGLLLSLQPSVAKNADEPWPDIPLNMPSEQRAFFKCLPCQNKQMSGPRGAAFRTQAAATRRKRAGVLGVGGLKTSDLQLTSSRASENSLCLSCLSFLLGVMKMSTVLVLSMSQEVLGLNRCIWSVPIPIFLIKNYLVGIWEHVSRKIGLDLRGEKTITTSWVKRVSLTMYSLGASSGRNASMSKFSCHKSPTLDHLGEKARTHRVTVW